MPSFMILKKSNFPIIRTLEKICNNPVAFSSLEFSHSVVTDSLQSHGLQHARVPCPPTPVAYSNSCPLSRWGHPTISSFSSNLRSFPHQGLFKWWVLRIRWPQYWIFSFSISPSNEYSYRCSIFSFLRKRFSSSSILFSKVAVPIYIPTNSVGVFPSLHIVSSIYYL